MIINDEQSSASDKQENRLNIVSMQEKKEVIYKTNFTMRDVFRMREAILMNCHDEVSAKNFLKLLQGPDALFLYNLHKNWLCS